MSRATESFLAKLHADVANTLSEQVTREEEEVIYNEDGEAVTTGKQIKTCSPAVLAVATKFLKDNSITCDVETEDNMGKLKAALERKQKRSTMSDPVQAGRSFGDH